MFELEDELYPELTLETDDILMNLTIKKDYSVFPTASERKEEFLNDLKAFIKEFDESPESLEFFKYYDDWLSSLSTIFELIISKALLMSTFVSKHPVVFRSAPWGWNFDKIIIIWFRSS